MHKVPNLVSDDPAEPAAGCDAAKPGRWRVALLGVCAVVLASCGGGENEPEFTGSTSNATTQSVASSADESQFATQALQAINTIRASARNCGSTNFVPAPALSWSPALATAALEHSQWMRANEQFSHTGANGSDVGSRATAAGYAWRAIGENIAGGQADIDAVMLAWVNSPGHCANLMNPVYQHVGLARVDGQNSNAFNTYWTMVVGAD